MENQVFTLPRLENYVDFTSSENPSGLPIEVKIDGQLAYASVEIPTHMAGWKGSEETFASKGAVATILDTVMAFGGIAFLKKATNTKTLSVEYFTQVPLGTELRAEAKLLQERGGNEAIMSGVLLDTNGTLLAQATGTYATYSVAELKGVSKGPFSKLALGPNVERPSACCSAPDVERFEHLLKTM